MPHRARRTSTSGRPRPRLHEPGWIPKTRQRLEQWIARGAGQGLPVVFDFDNTIVCGDIGEATLAMLVRNGRLSPQTVNPGLCPAVRRRGGEKMTLASIPDLTAYYEALLEPNAHSAADRSPLANGYVWAVEVMEGLMLRDVIEATRKTFALSCPGTERYLEVTPGMTAYLVPFFYPQMVELIAVLLQHEFAVWIVSASNVWSVRWMVQHALNPLLQARGVSPEVPPQQVAGVAALLTNPRGEILKDAVLVQEHPSYGALRATALRSLRLTSRLQFPVPVYSGKVACLWDLIGRRPYLGIGDSPGDHPMLTFSEHRLWVARLDKLAYQAQTRDLIQRSNRDTWIMQPTLTRFAPGFVADPARLSLAGLGRRPPFRIAVQKSLEILELIPGKTPST